MSRSIEFSEAPASLRNAAPAKPEAEPDRSKALALKFIERADALGLKGVKRDTAALEFWCGAATAADLCGDSEWSRTLGAQAVLIIAIRGWMGVQRIAGNLPA